MYQVKEITQFIVFFDNRIRSHGRNVRFPSPPSFTSFRCKSSDSCKLIHRFVNEWYAVQLAAKGTVERTMEQDDRLPWIEYEWNFSKTSVFGGEFTFGSGILCLTSDWTTIPVIDVLIE